MKEKVTKRLDVRRAGFFLRIVFGAGRRVQEQLRLALAEPVERIAAEAGGDRVEPGR